MNETIQPRSSTGFPAATARSRPAPVTALCTTQRYRPIDTERQQDADRIGAWILNLDRLDPIGFSVLFAIHALMRAQRTHSGWIARSDLCRSANLDAVRLGATIRTLERRGLIRAFSHPRKPGWARYMLIIR